MPKDPRRDDTDPPPAEHVARQVGPLRVPAKDGGDPLWVRRAREESEKATADAAKAREELRTAQEETRIAIAEAERLRIENQERLEKPPVVTRVERGESSGSMRAVKDRWTPQNMASAAGVIVSILATAGITKGCNNEAHTQEMAAKILVEVTAVSEKLTKEADARKLNDKAHDMQIADVASLAAQLNGGNPNGEWPAKTAGWDVPSIGSERMPRFQVNRNFPDLIDAKDALEDEELRKQ